MGKCHLSLKKKRPFLWMATRPLLQIFDRNDDASKPKHIQRKTKEADDVEAQVGEVDEAFWVPN